MIIIAGLGNPEKEYALHRHNAGFMILNKLASATNAVFKQDKYMSGCFIKTKEYMLLKPSTFMNNSGQSIIKALENTGVEAKNLWVVHDDTEFPLGQVRIKFGGTSGGHNGIKSVDEALGSADYWRIRIGVGRPDNASIDLADYVLSIFTANERRLLDSVIDQTVAYLLKCLKEGKIAAETLTVNK